MTRFFNIAGPCNPADHYIISTTDRLPEVERLVDQKAYFVLHAPRQTGKTTLLLELAKKLTDSGRYTSALLSLEVGAAFNDDPGAAELAILGDWRRSLLFDLPTELHPPAWPAADPGQRLAIALSHWATTATRP